jgi:HEAT repeat protein
MPSPAAERLFRAIFWSAAAGAVAVLLGVLAFLALPAWCPMLTLRHAPIPGMVIRANGVDDSAPALYSQRIRDFGERAVPALLSYLESSDRRYRLSAAAGVYAAHELIPDEPLLRFAGDADASVAQWMYASLAKRPFVHAYEPVFVAGIRSPSENIRIDSLRVLAKNRVELGDADLAGLAKDASGEVRWRCANYLGLVRSRARSALVAMLIDDADSHVRTQAILAAGRIGSDDLLVKVRGLATDPDETIRRWAEGALAEWGKAP